MLKQTFLSAVSDPNQKFFKGPKIMKSIPLLAGTAAKIQALKQ